MKNILIIEDNLEVRENTAEILELAGYKVFTAENGKIGVEVAIDEKPDLIVCDIMMPVLDGYGVLHLLSKNPDTAVIPFIFLTAKAEKSDYQKGMEMGADGYIAKPFDDTELLNAIETRLKKAEILKQTFSQDHVGVTDFIDSVNSNTNIKLLSDRYEIVRYKKKHILYSEGAHPRNLFFVKSGKIKTLKINEDGKELIIEISSNGDFVGYTPILEDTPYKDSAEVLEDVELMIIPREDFVKLITYDSQVAGQFIKLLAKNIHEKEDRLLSLAYNSVRKRVASGLIEISDKFKSQLQEDTRIKISRDDLARIVGTATESLIRTLSDFKSEKLIDIESGKILLLQENKLRNLSN
ncbi:MAG TPA: transcriptional regulator [Cytophagales bacterium]|nr:transcriptional regulator [Cytophagales bacterium]